MAADEVDLLLAHRLRAILRPRGGPKDVLHRVVGAEHPHRLGAANHVAAAVDRVRRDAGELGCRAEGVVDRVVVVVHDHRIRTLVGDDALGRDVGEEGVAQLAEVLGPDLGREVGADELVVEPHLVGGVAPEREPVDLERSPGVGTHTRDERVDRRAILGRDPLVHDEGGDAHRPRDEVAALAARGAHLLPHGERRLRTDGGRGHRDAVHLQHSVASHGDDLHVMLRERLEHERLGERVLPDVGERGEQHDLHEG